MANINSRTVREYILDTEQRFNEGELYYGHGTSEALDEAAWLVGSALGILPGGLDAELDRELTGDELARLDALVTRRINERIPVAYLLKEAWFAGHRFYIDQRALIPRSLIGEYVLEHFQPWIDEHRVHDVLDLCTGSGCIAIAVALEFPEARVDAADISVDALAVAERNVHEYGLADRVTITQSNVFENLPGRQYDVIVSNPPYVPRSSMLELPAEYKHEPELALVAENEGLSIVAEILFRSAAYLRPGGILIVEVGESREALEQRFPEIPFTWLAHGSGEDSVFLLSRSDLPLPRN
jgi:ribosomal protein L3 glutamine methyltransferase